ncbi:hypothetical protein P3T76_004784 [Phytophthora citrophthora]|uniref:Uncharacterized protein n=1 Tax=Phytophthora citrophthora TaxID=4793 RepID=A0AAD9LN24_9STRA|nr:hypothetical protein P3T76_004784 [Phytophthora citrophthora]
MTTIDKAFGMTPYAVQETYVGSGCTGLTEITAYIADGLCHLGGDATTSYRVTWNPTSVPAALTIETFSYGGCFSGAITPIIVGSAYIGGTCVSDTKKVYVGGLASKLTVITTYSDSACTIPVQAVFSSPATTCITQSKCTPAVNGLYMNQGCATDYATFLSYIFQSTVRLVTDIYEGNYTSKCATRQGIVAYVGDGVCHPNIDGTTSFKVMLGETAINSTWLMTYSNGNCTKGVSALEITPELLAAGSCDASTSMKFVISAGETPIPTPIPVTDGSGKSSATSFLSVPAFGVMTTAGGVLGGMLMFLS